MFFFVIEDESWGVFFVLNVCCVGFFICMIVWEIFFVLLGYVIVFMVVFDLFLWDEGLNVFCVFWGGSLELFLILWFIEFLDGVVDFGVIVLDK